MAEGQEDSSKSTEEIEKEWKEARYFIANGPSATLEFLKEEPKIWLHAYHAQALDGPCNEAEVEAPLQDLAVRKRRDARRLLGAMPSLEAKQKYVAMLTSVLPSWKSWYAENEPQAGRGARDGTGGGGGRGGGRGGRGGSTQGDVVGEVEQQPAGDARSGETDKLLRMFHKRTGLKFPSINVPSRL
eukprot:jgi/Mesen1/713/ME000109S_10928